jgi:DNA-binding NarL/FixJ family response regulator
MPSSAAIPLQFADILVFQKPCFDPYEPGPVLRTLDPAVVLRHVHSLGAAVDQILDRAPDLIFFGGAMSRHDTPETSLPVVRRFGYRGPVVVLSSNMHRRRSTELEQLGIAAALHRDDADVATMRAMLERIAVKPG